MTISDRLARIPAWMLFVGFGLGIAVIGLGAAPITRLIAPHVENKIAAQYPSNQQGDGNKAAAPSKEQSSSVTAFLDQELLDARTRLQVAEKRMTATRGGNAQTKEKAQQDYDAAKSQYAYLTATIKEAAAASSIEHDSEKRESDPRPKANPAAIMDRQIL